jgi:hypothetical protein
VCGSARWGIDRDGPARGKQCFDVRFGDANIPSPGEEVAGEDMMGRSILRGGWYGKACEKSGRDCCPSDQVPAHA